MLSTVIHFKAEDKVIRGLEVYKNARHGKKYRDYMLALLEMSLASVRYAVVAEQM